MLSDERADLRTVNEQAAFIVADGTPLVWASRLQGQPLPERVAGSDLIFDVCERAARDGLRIFLLGGGEGIGEAAAAGLSQRYPGLKVVGIESPPYRELTAVENATLKDQIRAAAPHVLIVAFTMPRGELWIHENHRDLGVPLCVNFGAALDFAAGRVPRAPRAIQVVGFEWLFRLSREPKRLFKRYARNAGFAFGMVIRDLASLPLQRLRKPITVVVKDLAADREGAQT